MLHRLLPPSIDNAHRGSRGALWILGLLAVAKLGIGLGAIFNGRSTAISADGIPLDSFSADGARTVVALFALWGLGQLLLGLICLLALVRYRAMVPLVFVALLLENVGRKAILWFLPYASVARTSNLVINAVLVALMLVGLALSLWRRE